MSRRPGRAAAFIAAAVAVVALEWWWQGKTYWLYSEGVYLATSREVLDGAELYEQVAAAQPPLLFLLGAGLLEISDSILFVRAAVSLATVVTGCLVALAVWRLTGRRGAAVVGGLASLVTPWMLREHAALTPEPLAAPLLLGSALLAARARLAPLAGGLAVVAASLKLAFVLPAAALAIAAASRRRFLAGAVAAAAALGLAFLLRWGQPLIDNVVVAQRQAGFQPELLPGHIAQAVWNLAPLVALASLAVLRREHARELPLLWTLTALAAGSLGMLFSLAKDGTYLNVLAAIEPLCVPLAVAGIVWLFEDRGWPARGRRLARAAAAGAVLFIGVQSLTLVASPRNPVGFGNPFLSAAPRQILSSEAVDRAVRQARKCPPGVPYSGVPYVAFIAGRPLPGGQPDGFIVNKAAVHRGLRRAVDRDRPRCPRAPLAPIAGTD